MLIRGELCLGSAMGSKSWLHPAPTYRPMETYWDTDEDAPGPRCGHTLTAVAATSSRGPRLILFGGATAIEGGGSSSAPGISCDLVSLIPFFLWKDPCLINFCGLISFRTGRSYQFRSFL